MEYASHIQMVIERARSQGAILVVHQEAKKIAINIGKPEAETEIAEDLLQAALDHRISIEFDRP